eukprot:CAMPEP_0202918332 /NCGR_PEP_ID=MMETSP1392-20130828/73196_1 /ASSEMBLY_ACC=CAM_ASM_000868 /TAXON_ID=225041 /ORGANISM="Chlamydomonas chlamydogama, Strain SAG 11-48b" /LENGTH=73 /DNA_ID=CAMNT_0049611355 /DNA_START=285 /DNA_END=506 /DNA_ORIENTATION=+
MRQPTGSEGSSSSPSAAAFRFPARVLPAEAVGVLYVGVYAKALELRPRLLVRRPEGPRVLPPDEAPKDVWRIM